MSNALSPDDLSFLRSEIKRRGLNRVAKDMRMPRNTVASVAAEVARDGSNAVARDGVAALRANHDPGARHD